MLAEVGLADDVDRLATALLKAPGVGPAHFAPLLDALREWDGENRADRLRAGVTRYGLRVSPSPTPSSGCPTVWTAGAPRSSQQIPALPPSSATCCES